MHSVIVEEGMTVEERFSPGIPQAVVIIGANIHEIRHVLKAEVANHSTLDFLHLSNKYYSATVNLLSFGNVRGFLDWKKKFNDKKVGAIIVHVRSDIDNTLSELYQYSKEFPIVDIQSQVVVVDEMNSLSFGVKERLEEWCRHNDFEAVVLTPDKEYVDERIKDGETWGVRRVVECLDTVVWWEKEMKVPKTFGVPGLDAVIGELDNLDESSDDEDWQPTEEDMDVIKALILKASRVQTPPPRISPVEVTAEASVNVSVTQAKGGVTGSAMVMVSSGDGTPNGECTGVSENTKGGKKAKKKKGKKGKSESPPEEIEKSQEATATIHIPPKEESIAKAPIAEEDSEVEDLEEYRKNSAHLHKVLEQEGIMGQLITKLRERGSQNSPRGRDSGFSNKDRVKLTEATNTMQSICSGLGLSSLTSQLDEVERLRASGVKVVDSSDEEVEEEQQKEKDKKE